MPAVTLALWGGLLADDPGRRDREQQWRRDRVLTHLVRGMGIDPALADAVWGSTVATLRSAWLDDHHTVGIARALGEGLACHGLRPSPGFDELVADLETRALDELPEALPGAREALEALAGRWPVGVICDVRITPAPVLRDVLEMLDLAGPIDSAVFSDEVGAARPARAPFRIAAQELGVPLSEMVHVGPSEGRDVLGAHAAGACAVRLGEPPTVAEGHCESLREVPDTVAAVIDAW
jgi:FMN phosphatase YigB (HAD superfamily)